MPKPDKTMLYTLILGGAALAAGAGAGAVVTRPARKSGGLAATYARVRSIFGDPPTTPGVKGRVTVDPAWVAAHIVPVRLHTGHVVKLHKLVARDFADAFAAACKASGWTPASVQTWVTRHLNWDPAAPLSLHTWGIAVDFDPPDNVRKAGAGRQSIAAHPAFIAEMERRGWQWGGRWSTDFDPMHFQKTTV